EVDDEAAQSCVTARRRAAANCRARGPFGTQAPLEPSQFASISAWTNPSHGASSRRHAETYLRLVHRRRPQALCALDHGSRGFRRKLLLSGPAGCDADPDVAGAPAARLAL